ncbi:MAG: hypothetical protein ABSD67_07545 [Terracidiphilus sp.]|jgi:hypothetical protein
MTLMDAPKFDEVRDQRRRVILYGSSGGLFLLIVIWWLVAGRPIDWPWNWNHHLMGRAAANEFLTAVEKNDLPKAYGIWIHDKNWQQHPNLNGAYPFSRFQGDWSSTSPDNEYGNIQTHKIVAARMYGNVLLMAILINGRKSGALNIDYDPKTHQLNFSPPGVELYLGP